MFPSDPLSVSSVFSLYQSFFLPCSRKELHVLSFHKTLPFLLPMPWLIIRLRHLLCTCQSCPIPSPFSLYLLSRLSPLILSFSPTSDLPPSLPCSKERTTCAIYPSPSPCLFCCQCPGWSSGCAIYSALVSPAPLPFSLYLLCFPQALSPLLLSFPHL